MFYPLKSQNEYLFNCDDVIENLSDFDDDIALPVVCDTEFTEADFWGKLDNELSFTRNIDGENIKIVIPKKSGYRLGITSQWKGIHQEFGKIYTTRDFKIYSDIIGKKPRHKIARNDFHLIDYLNDLGYQSKIKRTADIFGGKSKNRKQVDSKKFKKCQIILYGHFLLAEIGRIFENELLDDIKSLFEFNFQMGKRLKTSNGQFGDYADLPWLIVINGVRYWVQLKLIDTTALHGNATYKDLCEAANIKLGDKDKMDKYKTQMDVGYYENPEDFDAYSLGDLEVYKILENNAANFEKIYESLGIAEFYKPPKLTIGATVANIFRSILMKTLGISSGDTLENHPKLLELAIAQKYKFNKKNWQPQNFSAEKFVLDTFCKYGTSEELKNYTKSKAALNSKVMGGRCRNNNPTLTALIDPLVDLDIDGCYGEGQRNQDYPIGMPVIEGCSYSTSSNGNHYPSLRQWLKSKGYGTKNFILVPGLWQVWVSNREIKNGDNPVYDELKNDIDLIPSWHNFSFKDVDKILSDCQQNSDDQYIDVKAGKVKVYSNQIVNGTLTHDLFQIIENQTNPQQKKELFDNLYVHASLYYPSYGECNSFDELIDKMLSSREEIITYTKQLSDNSTLQTTLKKTPTYWLRFNMGEMITNQLLSWRKCYPKKTPMNTLYKLIVNTIYGIMVSPFFDISNVCVGNNITARARALCYLMEKGLGGILSITDGNPFNLNRVIYPTDNRKLTLTTLQKINDTDQRTLQRKYHVKLASLDNADKIELKWFTRGSNTDWGWGKGKAEYIPQLEIHRGNKIEYLTDSSASDWINRKTFEHLQNIFSENIDVLHKETTELKVKIGTDNNGNPYPITSLIPRKGLYKFEMKDFYDKGVFHGSSNYLLINPNGYNIAFRAYESKKNHEFVESIMGDSIKFSVCEEEFFGKVITDPARKFLYSILKNPKLLSRQQCFYKNGILKLTDYNHNRRYENKGYFPGDTIIKPGLLRELSLAQFTYRTIDQFKNIERQYINSKGKYSQFIEMFFTDENSFLEYERMLIEINAAIKKGCNDLYEVFDPNNNRSRDIIKSHPAHKNYTNLRAKIYQTIVENCEELEEIDEFDFDIMGSIEGLEGYTASELAFSINDDIICDDESVLDW